MKAQSDGRTDRRSGQAIIFLMVVMVVGLLVVIWNFDLHNVVSTKVRVDNATDAAALSAARWQGISLNMIGELNLIQAAHVCARLRDPSDSNQVAQVRAEVEEIAQLRARLALNGPLMGFVAAQSAAFLNLNAKDEDNREDEMEDWLLERAEAFKSSGPYFEGSVREAYEGAWFEYGSMLASIANNKMVADSANTQFYRFYGASHILLDPQFYSAVSARDWCYFKEGINRDYIDSYQYFGDWDPLPNLATRTSVNSEYFSLNLRSYAVSLNFYQDEYVEPTIAGRYDYLDIEEGQMVDDMREHLEDEMDSNYEVNKGMLSAVQGLWFPWHAYDLGKWMGTPWPTSEDFPFEEGTKVRDEFNYRGADAAVDCYLEAVNFTPSMTVDADWIFWQAAAKPFGYLEDPGSTSVRRPPMYFGIVLPAFRNVRLIHNDLSSRTGGSYPGSAEHFYEHLPVYMEGGPDAVEDFGCWYCNQLVRWEEEDFRREGSEWLEENQDAIDREILCPPLDLYNGGGSGGGGVGGAPMGRG